MPAQVTWEEAQGHRQLREMDGLYNLYRRLDNAATAGTLTEAIGVPATPSPEEIERRIESLILKLREVGRRAGLKPSHIEFLVSMTSHRRQQKDNPAAWKAIRDRKRAALYPEIEDLVDSIRALRKSFIRP